MFRMLPAAIIAYALTGAAWAQDEDLLRGPTIAETDEKSLVGASMTGEFTRVQGRPEAAALRLLDLDEETMASAQVVVDDRAMAIAMLLVDEIEAVKEISDLTTAGRGAEAREALEKLHVAFEGDVRDPLMAPLAGVLSDEDHAQLQAIVDEYWDALVDWELREVEQVTPARRQRTEQRAVFRVFQQEVREGYEVSLRRYREALDAIYAAVEPTPEQRAVMRDIVVEHIRDTRLSATLEERRATMMRMYHELDDDRQALFVQYLLEIILVDQP